MRAQQRTEKKNKTDKDELFENEIILADVE